MANIICNFFKYQLAGGSVSLSADTFYCALVTSAISLSSTEQIREIVNWSEVSACEVSGVGYTTGGQVMSAGMVLSNDTTNNRAKWDTNNLTWANTTLSAVRGAIIYKDGGTPVVGFVDFGENKETSNASFNLNWSIYGILTAS